MSFVKVLVLIQVLAVLEHCYNVLGDEGDIVSSAQSTHLHAPANPPVEPPKHPKTQPPAQLPVHPPIHPPPAHDLTPIYPPAHHPHHTHPPAHHHHRHIHSPAHHLLVHPPAYPPSHTPVHPPAYAPSHPPAHLHPLPERSFVAVQGVVYCKSCNYSGAETLLGATPLLGATVKLECNNTKYRAVVQEAKTDKNGYFLIMAPNSITTFGSHKCKVSLLSSPAACSKPTDLHSGQKGAPLAAQKASPFRLPHPLRPYQLFTVGPFAFEPPTKCLH
ncbi:hypothetical protein U1Q18_009201 [Sarracenia purpurea var. burkii]